MRKVSKTYKRWDDCFEGIDRLLNSCVNAILACPGGAVGCMPGYEIKASTGTLILKRVFENTCA